VSGSMANRRGSNGVQSEHEARMTGAGPEVTE
jgi:hypothetical protein